MTTLCGEASQNYTCMSQAYRPVKLSGYPCKFPSGTSHPASTSPYRVECKNSSNVMNYLMNCVSISIAAWSVGWSTMIFSPETDLELKAKHIGSKTSGCECRKLEQWWLTSLVKVITQSSRKDLILSDIMGLVLLLLPHCKKEQKAQKNITDTRKDGKISQV